MKVRNKNIVEANGKAFNAGHEFTITKKFDDGTFNAEDMDGNQIAVYSNPDQTSLSQNRFVENFEVI